MSTTEALQLAILFHDTYERLAPSFGYETRADTKAFDPDSANGKLMQAVCGELRAALASQAQVTDDMRNAVRFAPSSAYWSERLRELFGPNARDGIDAMERQIAALAAAAPSPAPASLMSVVEQILDVGHMNTEDLARLRAAWEASAPMLNGLTASETAETASEPKCSPTLTECPKCHNDFRKCDRGEVPAEPSVSPKPWQNNKMNPWVCTLTPHQARRVGKSGEEVGELGSVLGRLQIQALHDIDPSSGKTNFQRLWEESADVEAQTTCNRKAFKFPEPDYTDRVMRKIAQMGEWEEHYADAPARDAGLSDEQDLTDIIAEGIRGAYWCDRVWSAWQVGTMSEDDFTPAEDTDLPGDIARSILAAAQEKTGERNG